MTQSSPLSMNNTHSAQSTEQEIDLIALLGTLLDRKWFILILTTSFMIIGLAYAILATPIYKASAMLQVEESTPSLPGLDDMTSMFEGSSEAVTEIELLKSRTIIGQAVDNLGLTIEIVPNTFPMIGGKVQRSFFSIDATAVNTPLLGMSEYAWGGEKLEIHEFSVPSYLEGETFRLVKIDEARWALYATNDEIVLQGVVGQAAQNEMFSLTIKTFQARPSTEFEIIKHDRFAIIKTLQEEIAASEKGKDSGIIMVSYEHHSPTIAKAIIDEIANIYVRQNVEKNSAEAAQSLAFLKVQLPQVKQQLEAAEAKYNAYQQAQNSVNISLETQAVLEQVVEIDTLLQELELKRVELNRKFTSEHPTYQAVDKQVRSLNKEKESMLEGINALPETQQELLRLLRDVEVNTEIYTLLLTKTQELDIVRAGTLGNVRIVDSAAVDVTEPVKPKKALVVVVATLLGGFLAVAIVLIQRALHRGVEDAVEIENIGLSVYATIPHSDIQEKFSEKFKSSFKRKAHFQDVLAIREPADQAVESLRSLRTSLHFVMLQANSNVLAISGPSPGVGKSFISSNLAAVLAAGEKRVLLIDADMRKGYLHKAFGVNAENGLSDILSGSRNYQELIKKTSEDNLDVITRGIVPPNPSELLMHGLFAELILQVKAQYDIVLVDTPPILAVTDPSIIANHVGSTILVTRFAQNPVREIELACKRFENAGTTIHGVILNDVKRTASSKYGYYGYYNYEYTSDKS